jgi:hypothetical protein
MSRKAQFPTFPSPPSRGLDVQWATSLVRSLDQLAYILQNPGEGRLTTLVLTDLPTSDSGLEDGSLFRVGNQLFITARDLSYPAGATATARLGTVTVTV